MKQIPLNSKKYPGLFALVDDEDFERLSQFSWHPHPYKSGFYAIRKTARIDGKQTAIMMHRQIMEVSDPKMYIDHKNSNGLDNQRHNLRVATRSENNMNRGKTKKNTSGYKGVRRNRSGKYEAQIRCENKLHYLGTFSTALEASAAYESRAKELFGEFYRDNDLTV